MDDLMKPVRTDYKTPDQEEANLIENEANVQLSRPAINQESSDVTDSPRSAYHSLEILKREPNLKTIFEVLKYLSHSVSFCLPSPLTSQLINVLVTEMVPHIWPILSELESNGKKHVYEQPRTQLLEILKSASGLGAIVTRLKAVLAEKEQKAGPEADSRLQFLVDYLQVLCAVLKDKSTLSDLYNTISSSGSIATQRAVWNEVTALLAGGRLIGVAAEAYNVVKVLTAVTEIDFWVSDGKEYSRWIGSNIAFWASEPSRKGDNPDQWKAIAEVVRKGLRLGYPDILHENLIKLVLENEDALREYLAVLPKPDQKPFFSAAMNASSRWFLSSEPSHGPTDWWKTDEKAVAGVAAFLQLLAGQQNMGKTQLIPWMTGISGAGPGEPVGIRRAAVVVFAKNRHVLENVLEKCMELFGDQLYIKHTPSIQQESLAQILLLAAGYVHELSPLKLRMLARSSLYLNAVSNRLACPSERARFLGMIVGESLSKLTEAEGKQMDFKIEDLKTAEAKWYKSLVLVRDTIGSISDLRALKPSLGAQARTKRSKPLAKTSNGSRKAPSTKTVISIKELDDDDGDEDVDDDDLAAYAKPDSDAEDSEDDATLVTRNKPVAPVYIRELIFYLRDTDNYDRQKLALTTAASLIRRKACFGMEVKDHTEELASILMGLQNKFEIDNFNELHLQAMIAVLLSDPLNMAKWYAKTFFDGDYSVAQRASVLTTITMAARELGGLGAEDKQLTDAPSDELFPSKQLPGRLHQVYGIEASAVDSLAEQMSKAMIQPLADHLADKATGPNILKMRTFSSRLAVESRRAAPTTNKLSTITADSFFYPLTGRFFSHLKAYGGRNVIFESYLLNCFVKTLSLLLHASGKNTLQLPQMTREFWDLLLALRSHTTGDMAVAGALLFGFMTILEINEDKRRLSEQHGRELIETQKWVEALFQSIGHGSEEEKIQQLAAGVLFKIREVVQKYQALLMGDMVG